MTHIQLHIERLVLEGVAIAPGQRALLQAAVEAELGRLLTQGGLTEGLAGGGALPSIRASAIQLAPGGDPQRMGTQIAQSVYGGIGPSDKVTG
jgi:hypothetical protein